MRETIIHAACGALRIAVLTIASVTGAGAQDRQHPTPVLKSTFDDVRAVPLDRLPVAPKGVASDPDCLKRLDKAPLTPGGRLAAARGWTILDEQPIGDVEAVAIAGQIGAGTSGLCLVAHANIAFFANDRLIGVMYARGHNGSATFALRRLGKNALRLVGMVGPYADLTLKKGVLSIGPATIPEPVCGGKASVPAIFTKSIAEARQMLIGRDWRPVVHRPPEDDLSGRLADYRRRGWTEVSGCSGTGLGYCGFDYARGSIRLKVTTTDDPPRVADFTVACTPKERPR